MNAHIKRVAPFVVLLCTVQLLSACGPHGPKSMQQDDEEGWIGVYAQDLDPEMRRYLELKSDGGVLVNDVVADSPADRAGLQEEDIIVRFDGKRIRDSEDLVRVVRRKNLRDRVRVEIVRDGKKETVKLRIGSRREEFFADREHHSDDKHARVFRWRTRDRARLGIKMAELNEDLAEYFETGGREGVLVLAVVRDSPAEAAGIKAGDIITEIDDDRIRERQDVFDALEDRRPGDKVEIRVQRKGESRSFDATLAEIEHDHSFHFDDKEMRGFKDGVREWKHRIEEWAEGMEEHGHIKIDIPLQELGEDLESSLETMGEDLEREMERIEDELEELDLRIEVRKGQATI